MEVTHFDNLSTKQQVDKTHFDNLSNEEPIEIIHPSNLFIGKLIYSNIIGLIIDNLIERRTGNDLSELELVQMGDNNLLTKQLVKNQLVSLNSM
jgi:hypothetical protein